MSVPVIEKTQDTLKTGRLTYLREAEQPLSPADERLKKLRSLVQNNHVPLGIVPWKANLEQALTDALDLRPIHDQAIQLEQAYRGLISIWELGNEPDINFVKAMPDAYVSWAKAVYLGLKAGNPNSTVLHASLLLPPGPWLEQALSNDLLDYTDAYNFHYYGPAGELPGIIEAHRAAAWRGKRPLPLWITECGFELPTEPLPTPDDELRQAGYLVQAAQAAVDGGVSVFMPYVLWTRKDTGWSLLDPETFKPRRAWEAYATFTRNHSLKPGSAVLPANQTLPSIVPQWIPDRSTCRPYKMGGTYRTSSEGPVAGTIKLYNFGSSTISAIPGFSIDGKMGISLGSTFFSASGTPHTVPMAEKITIPAGQSMEIPAAFFLPEDSLHHRIKFNFEFAGSRLSFGIETTPQAAMFQPVDVSLTAPQTAADFQAVTDIEPSRITSHSGEWAGINGLKIRQNGKGSLLGPLLTFQVDKPTQHPSPPPMAISRVNGLPAGAWLRLSSPAGIRVDLVDVHGQRFTLAENFGRGYFDDSSDLWLCLRDFTPYIWSRFLPGRMHILPEEIREIQLRPYLEPNQPVTVHLECFVPKS